MPKNFPVRKSDYNYYSVLLRRLALALLFFWLSRLFFYIFNWSYFSHLSFPDAFRILIFGLRFDISSIFMLNAPFIILLTLPLPFRKYSLWRNLASFLFYFANILGLMVNYMDVVYFRFTQKRMTGDIFEFANNDISLASLMPQFVRDFWPYQLLFLFTTALLIIFAKRVKYKKGYRNQGAMRYYSFQIAGFLFAMFVVIVGIRGGFQLKPINIITAGKVAEAQDAAFVLNTPFTIIKTLDQKVLDRKNYYPDESLDGIYSPVFVPNSDLVNSQDSVLQPKNLVIIIMESLSSEHIGAFNLDKSDYAGFTPFLDSLMEHAVVFRGFANGKQSIEGIPAVVASIPSLLDRPYINSAYAGNKISSLANLLSEKGYTTEFFHGGTNGTMDFDGFARMAGYQKYFGRSEYANDADYDGNWGIFDVPFFQYFATTLNETPNPFFATIFSLSAHHPYTIPAKYQGKFREGNLEIQKTIMYADFALSEFFKTVSSASWFNNTIFVITADHTSEAYLPEYRTRVGMYKIPIIFYAPGMDLQKPDDKTADQVDIMPSVLGLLNYDKPFLAFGEDLFLEGKSSYAVNYLNGIYQFIEGSLVLDFDGNQSVALFDFNADPLLNNNIISQHPDKAERMEFLLKAYIQQYNNRMIDNRLVATP